MFEDQREGHGGCIGEFERKSRRTRGRRKIERDQIMK